MTKEEPFSGTLKVFNKTEDMENVKHARHLN
jgi:hypothetical protein